MAIYHLSVKPVSRASGRSATGAVAYRAGCEIADERTGEIHDYTRRGGVESAEIVLPDGAPEWARDRSQLWNAAELAEKRKDACVAREFEAALPAELSPEERQRLAVDFAKDMANREGCAVDVCIHAPGKEGDNRNHHAHIMRTTRKIEAEGMGEKLDTEKAGRGRRADLEEVRERWASMCNERLQENGHEARVDHRSLEAQGIDREPTQHKGPTVTAMERRGAPTRVGEGFLWGHPDHVRQPPAKGTGDEAQLQRRLELEEIERKVRARTEQLTSAEVRSYSNAQLGGLLSAMPEVKEAERRRQAADQRHTYEAEHLEALRKERAEIKPSALRRLFPRAFDRAAQLDEEIAAAQLAERAALKRARAESARAINTKGDALARVRGKFSDQFAALEKCASEKAHQEQTEKTNKELQERERKLEQEAAARAEKKEKEGAPGVDARPKPIRNAQMKSRGQSGPGIS